MENVVKEQGKLYSDISPRIMNQYGLEIMKNYLKPGYRILDVGCGTGEVSAHLLDIVGSNGSFLGVDPDKDRIAIAQENVKHPNAKFSICKGSEIPLDDTNKFDFALSNIVFHWMDADEKQATLKNVFHTLKVGGVFVIQYIDPYPPIYVKVIQFLGEEQLKKFKKWYHEMPLTELAEMSKELGFEVLHTKKFVMKGRWNTLRELADFLNAVLSGLIDFSKVEEKITKEGLEIPESWKEDGVFGGSAQTNQLILRKPFLG